MIDGLDNRTLLLVAGALYVLLPPSTWLVLRMPFERGPALWCVGGMIGGLGLILMGLRGFVPDVVSYLIGQPLLALGAVIVAQSLRLEVGRGWPWRWIVLATLLYVSALAAALALGNALMLGVLVRVFNLTAIACLILSAYQVAQIEHSRNAMAIAAAYGIQAMGTFGNLINALSGSTDIQTLSGGSIAAAGSLVTLLVSMVAAMAYLGLALERSARRQVALATELMRARQWHERRDTLIRLDRQRMLEVLADSLGHEITQPLTAAQIRVDTARLDLNRHGIDLERQLEWLRSLIIEIRRAGQTVSRIRDLVKPQSMRHELVDLRATLRTLRELLRQRAINRNLPLVIDIRGAPVWVLGDGLQLLQALMQVVRNAMAAVDGRPQGEVRVRLEMSGARVLMKVTDNGPGLPDEVLDAAGSREHSPRSSLQGIGLFVVQSILQRHHGELLLENVGSGGASVMIALPLHQPVLTMTHESASAT
jgi:signal transduction histidine kinase